MTATLSEIGAAKYVLLTTFKKDGSGVPAPLWAAMDGDRMLMWTESKSWKVKRIKNRSRVTVGVCDARGNPKGPQIDATAVVLDDAGTEETRDAIARKYGLIGWIAVKGSILRRGRKGTVGLAITAPSS
ncbi:PPOX class F420-dependent oxidoreductase [Rhodococcus hoagii]|uniref:PPOX class F420-dependent oxidoreductase n=1 Tax=Rhodococcus hoagii TaxID=43767 RepID=UPI000A0F9C23|nr:PPOX class F420-dependent oxidoreductase [Prescottella equi]MBM4519184.1 PPOX class F420-dependent oxidoreductase [Prescottella equi]MBM4530998.1 PPOX class F420-dependent oxidoreductase [Prescottella equi]MBM4544778.1 PPOX class F420-dependent oxidoreductase [Prescottella equi]MBM4571547.1 PPOX class F420-dependent oxidoreductase [Prescottella equi]MBM4603818.1 PPOX class F420-dependent oxidoreductase [Prescottella equi]